MIHIDIDSDWEDQRAVANAIQSVLDLLPFQSIVTTD
jgi:hypothetical protein